MVTRDVVIAALGRGLLHRTPRGVRVKRRPLADGKEGFKRGEGRCHYRDGVFDRTPEDFPGEGGVAVFVVQGDYSHDCDADYDEAEGEEDD